MLATSEIDLQAYMERIGYKGPLEQTAAVLRDLHRAQTLTIPFENLEIHLGGTIQLDPDSLVAKLITAKRGGYCYELNGLFELVLRQLGFPLTCLAARNIFSGEPLRQRSHKILLVTVEGREWLVDLGFGNNSLIEPLPFALDTEFPQFNDCYRLQFEAKLGYLLQVKILGEWKTLYAFSLDQFYPSDYRMMNYFNSTSPDTFFTQHRICVKPTPEERRTLLDYELKILRPEGPTVIVIKDEEEYLDVLKQYFGLEFAPGQKLRPLNLR